MTGERGGEGAWMEWSLLARITGEVLDNYTCKLGSKMKGYCRPNGHKRFLWLK